VLSQEYLGIENLPQELPKLTEYQLIAKVEVKMASTEGKDETPWNDELSDFTLTLDTGEKIKCHKFVLAKFSPVMKAMLTIDMVEARTNQMYLTGYDMATVTTFLELAYDKESMRGFGLSAQGVVVNWGMCELDRGKFSVALLKMADYYQVSDLRAICIANLKRNVQSIPDIWKTAEELDIMELKLSDDSIMRYVSEDKLSLLSNRGNPFLECHSCKNVTENPTFLIKCRHCNHYKYIVDRPKDCCNISKPSYK